MFGCGHLRVDGLHLAFCVNRISSLHALYSCWLKLPAADTCDYPAAAWLEDAICILVICGQITLITFFLVSSGSESPHCRIGPTLLCSAFLCKIIHFSSIKDVTKKKPPDFGFTRCRKGTEVLSDVADLHCFSVSEHVDQQSSRRYHREASSSDLVGPFCVSQSISHVINGRHGKIQISATFQAAHANPLLV